MSTPAEQIKERLDIVELVSQYVKLSRAGKNYKGLSPFTQEKTPSFFVSPERQMYYCFSTNKGGDIFTFIQELEGLDFRGALKMLAERAGVELREVSPGQRDERERLYGALEEAAAFYQQQLRTRKDVHAYLEERGLTERTITIWRLGFAPGPPEAGWSTLKDHMTAQGYTEKEILDAGLIKQGERGTSYDRFRSRITFPIKDAVGRVVGFSARHFGDPNDETAKYLNSPETELYDKSRILFGFDLAKQAIRKYDFVIFVEGQMDALMLYQAGFPNVVAVSGTALSAAHVSQIERLTRNVVLAYDADRAGIASALRSAGLLLPKGFDVKVLALPEGKDPADLVLEGGVERVKEVLRGAEHIVLYYLGLLEERLADERKRELAVREHVLPLIARMENAMDAAYFVKQIAERLRLPEEAVAREVERARRTATRAASRGNEPPAQDAPHERSEHAVQPTRHDLLARRVAGYLFWIGDDPERQREHQALVAELEAVGAHEPLLAEWTQERDQLVFEFELAYGDDESVQMVQELIDGYLHERAKRAYADALARLREAEKGNDEQRVEAALTELNELRTRLAGLAP